MCKRWGSHQFLDNELLEGSGWGARVQVTAFLGVVTSPPTEQFSGPLARRIILRRNALHSDAFISLGGT